MALFGRRKIYCDEPQITKANVISVLENALAIHAENRREINYLYKYYKGNQPVLRRTKKIRDDICNKIVENRAYEFVDFKTGYMLDGAIQYVSRSSSEKVTLEIGALNDMMVLCDKESLDSDLLEWMYICGVGYRMIMPHKNYITAEVVPKLKVGKTDFSKDESPFTIHALDPRNTFVVYHSGLEEEALMAVKYVLRQDGTTVYSIYTPYQYFEVVAEDATTELKLTSAPTRRQVGSIPIIEYPLNNALLGIVEIVSSISDAINAVQSNRFDGVEQFIQSLLVFYNCEIDDEAASTLREAGLIKLKSLGDNKADVKEIASELNQQETQVLVDYMYQTMLNIVGLPNRNGGASTSDTGAATLVRDGWETTERRAKKDEKKFKRSERKFLKIALDIVRHTVGTTLSLSDVDIKFPARSYKNKMAMAQILVTMLSNDKIHPLLAFTECELFDDPQSAYQMSVDYYNALKNPTNGGQEPEPANSTGNGNNSGNDGNDGNDEGNAND